MDGMMGNLTRSALREFQERNGLATINKVTNAVVAALKQKAVG